MSGLEQPWGDLLHRTYFLPKIDDIECDDFKTISSENIGRPVVPLGPPRKYVEGNMANLSPNIPINISRIPGKIENVYIREDCSPMRLKSTASCLKNFDTCSLGRMKKWQELTLALSSMK